MMLSFAESKILGVCTNENPQEMPQAVPPTAPEAEEKVV